MDPSAPREYQAKILPALRRIQARCGYLRRDELERLHRETGVPLYQLQSVASFYPHFRLTPPPRLTLKVCRDMACNLAGSRALRRDLRQFAGDRVAIEGVSCLGRCDRAPAACMVVQMTPKPDDGRPARGAQGAGDAKASAGDDNGDGHDDGRTNEFYYLGSAPERLKQVVTDYLAGRFPKPDLDGDQPYWSGDWQVDPYHGLKPTFAAAKKALEARDAALSASVAYLSKLPEWTPGRAEQFRAAAVAGNAEDAGDDDVREAVVTWQTDDGWARGVERGGWADKLLQELDDAHADLRGMGGAGVPATQKWRDVRDAVRTARRRGTDDRAFIIVNGDESEPGTFKDRELLLRAAHVVVEGVILAGLVTEATQGFVFIRHEYHEQIRACRDAIEAAERAGLCGRGARVLGRPFPVSVFVSPGGYICGEQSALVEAMSDRRAEPRNLPPKLETNGLEDLPTLVSNVETFAWVPYIWLNGGQAYAALGTNGWRGRRFFSVSGDVNRPGVYEVPIGLTLRDLIYGEDYARGVRGRRALKAVAPSGPSGGFLPPKLTAAAGLPDRYLTNPAWQKLAARRKLDPNAKELDVLDLELELGLFRSLSPTQALGAGIVVYAEGRDMADQAVNAINFFRNESCGKCVPCRIGSQKLATLGGNLMAGKVGAEEWQADLLPATRDLGEVMGLTSICALGRSVPLPLQTLVDYFKPDLSRHLVGGAGAGAVPVGGGVAGGTTGTRG